MVVSTKTLLGFKHYITFPEELSFTLCFTSSFAFPVGLASSLFQHSQYRKWQGYYYDDDSFSVRDKFFGLTASRYFTDSEAPLLMIAFFSVGYIFLSEFPTPLELMPWYWQAAHYVVPAAPAVLAFVKLNSMGGTLADIRPEMITLWIQVIVYFLLSLWVFKKEGILF